MIRSSEAIILKRIKYGDTSLVVHVFSPKEGRFSLLVNGVRKQKSSFNSSYFQPMNLVDITYYYKKSGLFRLKEIRMNTHYQTLNQNIVKSSIGVYSIEIIDKSISEESEGSDMYYFIKEFYQYLDLTRDSSNIHFWFFMKMAHYLGFAPSNDYSDEKKCFHLLEGVYSNEQEFESIYLLSEKLSLLFYRLSQSGVEDLRAIQMSREERHQLLEKLEYYFSLHLTGFGKIKSLAVLKGVLE